MIKQMVYYNAFNYELLAEGIYKSVHYFILSCGFYPFVLIEDSLDYERLSERSHGELYRLWEDNKITIFTKVGRKIDGMAFCGWNYDALEDDCYGALNSGRNNGKKRWTTEEILEDVIRAIDYRLLLWRGGTCMREQNGLTLNLSLGTCGFVCFTVFLILKLTNVIDWNWFWIWFPLWLPIAIGVAIFVITFLLVLVFDR